ncbi:exonuclease SbcCD subunit D [Bacteriovoracaceae bacterium]|nr:exonuclease SbcCD subunit D [Bacteriovoracaceae bacterium]
MVKLIHTSDWHLGKKLHRFSRRDDQIAAMNFFLKVVKDENIKVFIIAGDLFDQFRPDYVALNDLLSFLKQLIELNCYPVLITGNHDSIHLLGALNSYLKKDQITIFHDLISENEKIIQINNKRILFKGLPYFRENQLHEYYLKNTITKEVQCEAESTAIPDVEELLIQYSKIKCPEEYDYSIFIGHHLFSRFELSGSEDSVFLSGIDSINFKSLGQFDYFAFGHIHKYQKLEENAFYSGSPIPINFGEPQQKYYNIIQASEKNGCLQIVKCDLPQFRPLFYIKAQSDKILKKIESIPKVSIGNLEGIAEIMVTLKEPDPTLQDQIKAALLKKNIQVINYIPYLESDESFYSQAEFERIYSLNIDSLFQEYFLSKYPEINEVPTKYLQKFQDLKQGLDEV